MALAMGTMVGARPAGAVITGVCPDGSMFIVQKQSSVPCPDAKQVAPDDMPPLRPELLPKPFGWQQHQRRQDPNNPYNLVEDMRRSANAWSSGAAGGSQAPRPPAVGAAGARPQPPSVAAGPRGVVPPATRTAAPPPSARRPAREIEPVVALALNPDELRDLFLIVELSQEQAPASFVRAHDDGSEALYLALAYSEAFDLRFRQARLAPAQRTGSVLLFSALARQPTAFHGNLFFSQDHLAFHPDHADRSQFGVLEGELGDLDARSVALGYVVLPPSFDLARPIDLYWNDRRIQTVLQP